MLQTSQHTVSPPDINHPELIRRLLVCVVDLWTSALMWVSTQKANLLLAQRSEGDRHQAGVRWRLLATRLVTFLSECRPWETHHAWIGHAQCPAMQRRAFILSCRKQPSRSSRQLSHTMQLRYNGFMITQITAVYPSTCLSDVWKTLWHLGQHN